MPATALSRFASRFRKPIAAVGIGIRTTKLDLDALTPTNTSGDGAPSAAEANGSIYLRKNAANADEAVYSRIGGSWVALDGAP